LKLFCNCIHQLFSTHILPHNICPIKNLLGPGNGCFFLTDRLAAAQIQKSNNIINKIYLI
jgi:hypothetical protein